MQQYCIEQPLKQKKIGKHLFVNHGCVPLLPSSFVHIITHPKDYVSVSHRKVCINNMPPSNIANYCMWWFVVELFFSV